MRWMLWGAAATALVLGGSAPTFAQMAGRDEVRPPYRYGYGRPAPRVRHHYYRGYRYRPSAYRTCGLFHYWHAGRCLDARTNPPNLK